MSSDATTIPLRDGAAEQPVSGPQGDRRRRRLRSAGWTREQIEPALLLAVIVGASLLTVIIAADRPSYLSASTRAHYFPGWMAGPLGGLWPGLTRSTEALKLLFTAIVIAMYASYLLGLTRIPKLGARWVIGAILAVQLIFFLAPPLTLTDVFNYINYARMDVVHNLNPYATIPALEPHRDPAYGLSNWHELLSPYGPLFTIFMFAVVPFGVPMSFWLVKGVLALLTLTTLTLVWKCAQMLGRDPVKVVVFAGLNPIVLLWGLGGDHNDIVMMVFIMLALYLLLRSGALPRPSTGTGGDAGAPPAPAAPGAPPAPPASAGRAVHARAPSSGATSGPSRAQIVRGWVLPLSWPEMVAGFSLAAAVFVKASAGIVVPVIVVGLARAPRRAVQTVIGGIVGAVVLGAISYSVFGAHIPDLGTQGSIVIDMSLPNLLGLALGQGGETATLRVLLSLALVASVVACSVSAYRKGDVIGSSGWASIALLVTLAWVLPWYILWVLPLAALSRSRRLRIATFAISIYLLLVWLPSSPQLWSGIGFHPGSTPLAKLHHRYVKELLN